MKTKHRKTARPAPRPSPTIIAPVLPPFNPALRYPLPIACAFLDMSRSHLWAKARDGEIQVIREGRRTYVPGSEIARLSMAPLAAKDIAP